MSEFATKIDGTGYYISEENGFQPYGVQQGFTAGGQPSNYGPGTADMTALALAIDDPSTDYADPYGSSGTFRTLVNGYFSNLPSNGGLSDVETYDPRANDWISFTGRLDIVALLNSLAGGKALRGVPLKFSSAFIPDAERATYYGGDPSPVGTGSDYIPGDPVPPGDPETTGWDYGLWDSALWEQEAA
jgi:hypothetical protein